jgi:hypothetical protein
MFHEVLLIPIFTRSKWDTKRKLKSWAEVGIPSLVWIELGKRCFKEYPVARVASSVRTELGTSWDFLLVRTSCGNFC